MEINNYSKQLAEQRQSFNESMDDLRENQKNELEHVEEKNKAGRSKQAKTYRNSLENIEKNQKDYFVSTDKKTQDQLAEKSKNFKKEMNKTRSFFETDKVEKAEENRKRLEDIQHRFSESMRINDRDNKHRVDYLTNKFDDRLSTLNKDYNQNVERISDNSNNNMKKTIDEGNKENLELTKKYESEKRLNAADNSIARNRQQDLFETSLENLRKTQSSTASEMRDHNESLEYGQKAKNNAILSTMSEKHKNIADKMQDKMTFQKREMSKRNTKLTSDLQEKFRKDMLSMKRKTDRITEGELSTNGTKAKMERQQGRFDSRIENYKNREEELKFVQSLELDNQEISHKRAVQSKIDAFQKRIDKSSREHATFNIKQNEKFYDEKNKLLENNGLRLKNLEQTNFLQQLGDKRKFTNTLSNQRKEFAKTVNMMTDQNLETISDLQKDFSDEKSSYIQDTRIENHNISEKQKDDFQNRITDVISNYEEKIDKASKDKMKIISQFESKINEINVINSEQKQEQARITQQQRVEADRTHDRELNIIEYEFKKDFMAMKKQFDRQTASTKSNNDVHITKITKQHNSEMEQLLSENKREIQMKLGDAQRKLERIIDQNRLAIDSLRNQYEGKIDSMRNQNFIDAATKS